MTIHPDNNGPVPTDEFESALRTLILESFAAGVNVSGTWEIPSQSSIVPCWQITIEKRDGTSISDNVTFLDE